MREIEFRAKSLDSGEWIYGDLMRKKDKWYIHFYDCNNFECMYEIIPETVGQYTGLKDKNSKKIYEGDILLRQLIGNSSYLRGLFHKDWTKVVFEDGCFKSEWFREWSRNRGIVKKNIIKMNLDIYINEFEVIGNIHENKDLLEG